MMVAMNSHLLALVHEYQLAAKAAMDLMIQSGIPLPSSNMASATNSLPSTGVLAGVVRYRKHGYPQKDVPFWIRQASRPK
jgi:hypothetical protein